MEIFRIAKEKYARDISGAGAKLYGGRWNRPGLAVLYTSESRSLALLELIVHFASKSAFNEPHTYLTLEINETLIENLDINLLPKNELEINDNRLWKLADYYFLERKVAALRVPSVLIPQEFNIILNPNHIALKSLDIKNVEMVNLDERFKNSQIK
jgi:RES domain-containing protein